jgi:hypothetical protein
MGIYYLNGFYEKAYERNSFTNFVVHRLFINASRNADYVEMLLKFHIIQYEER